VTPIKHTIQCHCILPQYRNRKDPVFHRFIVFGCIDDSDTLITKHCECNNCGAVHRVFDICKSEILVGKESISAIMSIDDIKLSISSDLVSILESYNCELPVYEHVKFVYENRMFDQEIIIANEMMETEVIGKKLIFNEFGKVSIQPFSEQFNSMF